jgi:hypothetical protein
MFAAGHLSGTLTDVVTGRTYSFDAGMSGGGGGLALGVYRVTGTLRGGFDVFSRGFSIQFYSLGYGPLSVGGASITRGGPGGESLGEIDISGSFAAPAGAAGLGFNGTEAVLQNAGMCATNAR